MSGSSRGRAQVRTLVAASLAALVVPGLAFAAASSTDAGIPDGQYAAVEEPGVPGGAGLIFTLHGHHTISRPGFYCDPNATIAASSAFQNSAASFVDVDAPTFSLAANGDFAYRGNAKVTDGNGNKLTEAAVVIRGKYVRHGKTYHYDGSLGNAVTATLTFQGTVASTACANPKPRTFRLYRHDVDGRRLELTGGGNGRTDSLAVLPSDG